MALVMTKYKYNNKNYLVYERTILNKSFTSEQWSTICDDNNGISADFIIEIINAQIFVYNAQGQQILLNNQINDIIAFHEHQNDKLSSKISRIIEVRFTDKYINKLENTFINNAFIA